MPNANYQRGVRFERERLKHYLSRGAASASRTAGSHGKYDLYIILKDRITCIQCKVTDSAADMRRKLAQFKENPPLPPSAYFHQTLEVRVTGSTEVHSVTI